MNIHPIIIIPARLAATRLPNKPLIDIAGEPMIIRVARQAIAANICPVYVAAGDQEIFDCCQQYGINAVMTDSDLPSGSDRIHAALSIIEKETKDHFDTVINLQGDLPLIDKASLLKIIEILETAQDCDIATLVANITDQNEYADIHTVKAYVKFNVRSSICRAEDFSRSLLNDDLSHHFHHIGLYGYRKEALEKFINLPRSPREKSEKLEQLRALENGMVITAGLVSCVPIGVDTQEDYKKVLEVLNTEQRLVG